MMLLIRSFLIIFAICILTTHAELSTIERIKKHQEWLRQRGLIKPQTLKKTPATSDFWKIREPTKTIDHKSSPNNQFDDPRTNDVYPENETTTTTTSTTTTINSTTIWSSSPSSTTTDRVEISPMTTPLPVTTATTTKTSTTTDQPATSTSPRAVTISKRSTTTTTTNIPISTRSEEISTTTLKPKLRPKPYPRWGTWSPWSACSRTCSGGVMWQQRKCISKRPTTGKRYISNDCIGIYRRYHLCNEQACPPTDEDFRQQQCSAFDDVDFQGRKYVWEPYIKDDAECELNCKPLGMKYFATLNDTVIDGTTCFRPAEYYRSNYRGRAICVGGICKLRNEWGYLRVHVVRIHNLRNSIDGNENLLLGRVVILKLLEIELIFNLLGNYVERRPVFDFECKMIGLMSKVMAVLLAIQTSGVITGLSANSGTVGCGGLICRTITGIFTRNPLPEEAYVHVATIPAGASNISITELKNSINLLVLRTTDQKYLFNGDNAESPNGAYDAVGAVFDYRRIDGLQDGEGVTEWITCTGPIREMLELMIYSRDVNPGVKYEYLLPIGSDSEENEVSVESDMNLKSGNEDSGPGQPLRKRKFNWKVVGFSPCSKSCGGGTQTPVIRCVRENPTRYFSQRRCSHSEKPVLNENLLRCNTQPCPAFWRVDEWGECKCQHGDGIREREVSCVQELASGIVIQVNNVACLEEEPTAKKYCDCPKVNRRRNHHRHKNYNGRLQHSITANSTTNSHRRVTTEKDKSGTWLISNWNNYCSASCGPGVEYRSIFCDRSKPNTERCDLRFTPDTTRPCERELECITGDWFTGPWSNCSGSCFSLTKARQVLCIQNQLIVDDEDCKEADKPESTQKCELNDVEYCSPRWHYSSWSECTKSCDGGTQRRNVKCLEFDEHENTLRESTKCRYSKREPIYRSCNSNKCNEPRVDLIQNDIAPTCVDEFSNCHLAVKAKLCSYEYYQQNCCYSCGAEAA